eukprot:tig00000850_g4801.t1
MEALALTMQLNEAGDAFDGDSNGVQRRSARGAGAGASQPPAGSAGCEDTDEPAPRVLLAAAAAPATPRVDVSRATLRFRAAGAGGRRLDLEGRYARANAARRVLSTRIACGAGFLSCVVLFMSPSILFSYRVVQLVCAIVALLPPFILSFFPAPFARYFEHAACFGLIGFSISKSTAYVAILGHATHLLLTYLIVQWAACTALGLRFHVSLLVAAFLVLEYFVPPLVRYAALGAGALDGWSWMSLVSCFVSGAVACGSSYLRDRFERRLFFQELLALQETAGPAPGAEEAEAAAGPGASPPPDPGAYPPPPGSDGVSVGAGGGVPSFLRPWRVEPITPLDATRAAASSLFLVDHPASLPAACASDGETAESPAARGPPPLNAWPDTPSRLLGLDLPTGIPSVTKSPSVFALRPPPSAALSEGRVSSRSHLPLPDALLSRSMKAARRGVTPSAATPATPAAPTPGPAAPTPAPADPDALPPRRPRGSLLAQLVETVKGGRPFPNPAHEAEYRVFYAERAWRRALALSVVLVPAYLVVLAVGGLQAAAERGVPLRALADQFPRTEADWVVEIAVCGSFFVAAFAVFAARPRGSLPFGFALVASGLLLAQIARLVSLWRFLAAYRGLVGAEWTPEFLLRIAAVANLSFVAPTFFLPLRYALAKDAAALAFAAGVLFHSGYFADYALYWANFLLVPALIAAVVCARGELNLRRRFAIEAGLPPEM